MKLGYSSCSLEIFHTLELQCIAKARECVVVGAVTVAFVNIWA